MSRKMRRILPALALLLLSAVLVSTASFAWFSMNNEVRATGMKVEAVSSGSLVIDKDYAVGSDVTVSFDDGSDEAAKLIPINYNTKEKYYDYVDATSAGKVDPETGNGFDGAELTFDQVTDDNAGTYYMDYVVYIASAGGVLEGKTVNATVSFGSATLEQKATTVQFFVLGTNANINDQTYTMGATNVVPAAQTNASVTETVEVFKGRNIPMNTSNESIAVLMRVYFDGALADTSDPTKTFVRSAAVSGQSLEISVTFNAVDTVAEPTPEPGA